MSQQITLAQLQAAMAQHQCTAEHVLAAGYTCPEYTAQQTAQAAPVALSGAFDLMSFAQTAAPTASGNRTPAWECSIEELRGRVIVRDLQTPGHKDELNAKLRLNLAPVYVDLGAYGTLPDGSPIVHFVVPRAQQAAAEQKLKSDVMSGLHDKALLDAAQRCKASAEKKAENRGKRAPVDAAAATAALAALESGALGGQIAVEAAPQVQVSAEAPTLQLNTADLGGLTLPVL